MRYRNYVAQARNHSDHRLKITHLHRPQYNACDRLISVSAIPLPRCISLFPQPWRGDWSAPSTYPHPDYRRGRKTIKEGFTSRTYLEGDDDDASMVPLNLWTATSPDGERDEGEGGAAMAMGLGNPTDSEGTGVGSKAGNRTRPHASSLCSALRDPLLSCTARHGVHTWLETRVGQAAKAVGRKVRSDEESSPAGPVGWH